MLRHMLRGKIHRATVTGADLHYEGSITVDAELLDRASLLPHERVEVWNVTNGERFSTYVLPGRRDSGVVCINGAASHKASAGDLVIIAAFSWMSETEARTWTPAIVFVDGRNRRVEKRTERPGQAEGTRDWQ